MSKYVQVSQHRLDAIVNPHRVRRRVAQRTIRVPVSVAALMAIRDIHIIYRRPGSRTVYIRSRSGRYAALVATANGRWRVQGTPTTSLGPDYGRIDYTDAVRFTGRVRSQIELRNDFAATNPLTHRLGGPAQPLPATRDRTRRQTNQGMNHAMTTLGLGHASATAYAAACLGAAPGAYEWCHLIGHAMGGADGPGNIVAARQGNNSEQLMIENTLQLYRREGLFQVEVSASVLGDRTAAPPAPARHLGDVIAYEVTVPGRIPLQIYLDCRAPVRPSAIHATDVRRNVAQWCNHALVAAQGADAVTPAEAASVRRFVQDTFRRYLG